MQGAPERVWLSEIDAEIQSAKVTREDVEYVRADLARTPPADIAERARRAAEKIAANLFAEIFHPWGKGGISDEHERRLADIIAAEFGGGRGDEDNC